ncbi:ATPase component of ABC transporter [Frankia casuarinae]|jgi:ATP-binding cassette ChvD family protein|uniref:Energy-dependent translational throttle protein EttA n=2 Tax=Frankia casuarinae (strain DSM 45818 / CECT 9043 / HFP020203 / CcI3) TaxID=106370 RepID=Q2JDW5_FRACC|nr:MULTISPECIES: energy-dependent translational throttle protein EttA [Frankia]ABD10527.1 ABC transporter related [Frankia casuarinae]ETA03107.1 ATPase component of ABC transporter [Frankia sp. CcI6]EYT92053.1 ATPase component of ABC transporter [Frankia casuarinae]KEZ36553.1 ATP-binding cassette protein, ChvD family [Frankia sp. CeD]KFB06091.1 ATP-binding cassette protein, ChvD family [Frankia sp. Allo2]
MAQYVFQMRKARKAHGDKVILDDVTLSFLPGAKIGVVGPNGAGKSSLLKIMAGLDQPSNGEATLSPGYTVGMLAQEPPLDETKDVRGNVEDGVREIRRVLARYEEINEKMSAPDADFDSLLAEQAELIDKIEAANAWELDSQLDQAMDALRLPPGDADVTLLSGGERRRVALCKLLLEAPDLLLLDEPTNHLDAESVAWLEQHLARYAGAVLAVTHDRYFLDNVAGWILELDRGRALPYEGNYTTYLENKAARLKVEGQKDAKRRRVLAQELEWVRSNPKARQTKSKSRLARYEELAAEADRARPRDFEDIQIPPGPRLGNQVIEAKGLTKGFDDRLLIDNLSFTLPRGGIIGVIGPNGIGKTTLFKMLTGQEAPDAGELVIGDTVDIAYVDQTRSGLDPKKNVWQVVSDGLDHIVVGKVDFPSRAYVSSFGFKGPDQQKPVGVLSGGERNRLNLALTLKRGGNVLLLDEPTNDLDVETLRSLEDALLEFAGCAVVISHDRWFLDRVATHILAWEGTDEDPARWFWFEGNFADYETNKIDRLGQEAARPHRVTHRKLTRD